MSKEVKKDMVNRPSHYAGRNGIETIDAMRSSMTTEEFNGFLKGNVLKYSMRAGQKDALEQDANNIVWYAAFFYLSNGGTVDGLFKTAEYMKARFG